MIDYGPEELVPLFSNEAEMSALGSMVLSRRAAEEVAAMLSDDDFYRPSHRLIFRAMKRLMHQHQEIDLVTLRDEIKVMGAFKDVGGEDYLIQVAEYVPSPANSGFYAKLVADKATLRRVDQAFHDGRKLIHGDLEPEEKIAEIESVVRKAIGARQVPTLRSSQTLAKAFEARAEAEEAGAPLPRVFCGFGPIDKRTGGFRPGDLVIIGARPGMGKTALALDITINVARKIANGKENSAALFFSAEMSGDDLTDRAIAQISGVPSRKQGDPPHSPREEEYVLDATEMFYRLPIFIDESASLTPSKVRAISRKVQEEKGLSLIVIDYLQLMKAGGKQASRLEEVDTIARELKILAKELCVPVVALCQLSRSVENRENKRPQLSDLRESGQIEANADTVFLLYRDAYYKAQADQPQEAIEETEVIIAKQRRGKTGIARLGFEPSVTRFRTPAH